MQTPKAHQYWAEYPCIFELSLGLMSQLRACVGCPGFPRNTASIPFQKLKKDGNLWVGMLGFEQWCKDIPVTSEEDREGREQWV